MQLCLGDQEVWDNVRHAKSQSEPDFVKEIKQIAKGYSAV